MSEKVRVIEQPTKEEYGAAIEFTRKNGVIYVERMLSIPPSPNSPR